jgi:hypothetical protein
MVIGGGRAAERDLKPGVRGRREAAGDELAPADHRGVRAARIARRPADQDHSHVPRPDSDDAGTVCAIDAPSVVPAAFVVEIVGADRQRARRGRRDEPARLEDVLLARPRVVGRDHAYCSE